MSSPQFKEKEIKRAEQKFLNTTLTSYQRKAVKDIASIISKYIVINNNALQSFIWETLEDWQIEFSQSIEDLSTGIPENRISSMNIILGSVRYKLRNRLQKKSDKDVIDKSIERVFEAYKRAVLSS